MNEFEEEKTRLKEIKLILEEYCQISLDRLVEYIEEYNRLYSLLYKNKILIEDV